MVDDTACLFPEALNLISAVLSVTLLFGARKVSCGTGGQGETQLRREQGDMGKGHVGEKVRSYRQIFT